MKILIPGGHLTPALGLIDWIQKHHPQDEIIFVGRIYSQESLRQKAIEAFEVKKRDILFIPLQAAKLDSGFNLSWFLKPVQFIKSLIKAIKIVRQHKPDVIITFGGYVAVPLALVGKLLKVPIVAHEGTRVVGLANKLIFFLADKAAYAFADADNYDFKKLSQKKEVKQTGIPLRSAIKHEQNPAKPSWLQDYSSNQRLLLVMGGNQGSKVINDLIQDNLQQLTADFVVVHQCGRPNKLYNYQQDLSTAAEQLQISQSRYYVKPWIEEQDLVWLYQKASLAISRAGANTIQELVYQVVPAILIPLPRAHFNEQYKNAHYLTSRKAALLLPQEELAQAKLNSAIQDILKNRRHYVSNLVALKTTMPANPAQAIYQLAQSATDTIHSN